MGLCGRDRADRCPDADGQPAPDFPHHPAVQHDGVRCDLVTRAELDNIVLHKVVGQHLAPPAVAQAAELLR